MKKYEIALLGKQDLINRIRELEDKVADINFYKVIEQPQNPMIFRNSKKDIARMKTRLHQLISAEAAKD
ncbi:MAG: 50S ribosomal protein L29 [Chlorobiaceae bacterium]